MPLSDRKILGRDKLHDLSLIAAIATANHASRTSLLTGLAVFGVAQALQVWSKAVLRRDRELNTRGPYAVCRHPFYLANALMDIGLLIMSGYFWLLLVYPALFRLAYGPTIRREEGVLRSIFGGAYDVYARTTPRTLPLSPRMLRDWRAPLSWGVLRLERQVSRSLRHFVFPVLVALAVLFWDAGGIAWTDLTLAYAITITGLFLLSHAAYFSIEGRAEPAAVLCARLAWHAAAALALMTPAAVRVLHHRPESLLLGAVPVALLLAFGQLARRAQEDRVPPPIPSEVLAPPKALG